MIRGLLHVLPLRLQALLREKFVVVGRLDYPSTIELLIDSEVECVTRLRSCAKEPETIAWIEQYIQPEDLVFDIGANVGAYSLVIDRHTSGGATTFAFEPSPTTFSQLSRNVILNGAQGRIRPFQIAFAEKTGFCSMKFSSMNPGAALHELISNGAAGGIHQTVLCYTMDDFIRVFALSAPNHIKLDVDGAELEILRGANATLTNASLRTLLVELDPGPKGYAVVALLRQHGFQERSRHPHGTDSGATANCLFIRSPDAT